MCDCWWLAAVSTCYVLARLALQSNTRGGKDEARETTWLVTHFFLFSFYYYFSSQRESASKGTENEPHPSRGCWAHGPGSELSSCWRWSQRSTTGTEQVHLSTWAISTFISDPFGRAAFGLPCSFWLRWLHFSWLSQYWQWKHVTFKKNLPIKAKRFWNSHHEVQGTRDEFTPFKMACYVWMDEETEYFLKETLRKIKKIILDSKQNWNPDLLRTILFHPSRKWGIMPNLWK